MRFGPVIPAIGPVELFGCGYVKSRIPKIPNSIKGTYWAEKSDSGGCQMPQGDYAITDTLAVGQDLTSELAQRLGTRKWQQRHFIHLDS